MKYVIRDVSNDLKCRTHYILTDEDENKSEWIQWEGSECVGNMTIYWSIDMIALKIDRAIRLDVNDPQRSIDKIKKLAVLK
jgi:hypothetical protein